MPLIGVAVGSPLGHAIGTTAKYLAIGVLLAFGLYTLLSEDGENDRQRLARLTTLRGFPMAFLGTSISLDELAVGFTFAAATGSRCVARESV